MTLWRREWLAPALATTIFVVRVGLALVLIPPWQQPDEPQNLALIRLLIHERGGRPVDDLVLRYRGGLRDDPATEPLIVESMIAHRWWQHFGRAVPRPAPVSFAAAGEVVDADFGLPGGGMAYFIASAALLHFLSIDDLLAQLFTLRVVSALCGVLTLLAAWSGSRRLLGPTMAGGAVALIALHPQFLLVSTAANPDSLVNVCGALAWYFSAWCLTGRRPIVASFGLLAAALTGSLIKRVGLPVLAASAVVVLFSFARRSPRDMVRAAAFGAVGLAAAAAVAAYWAPDELRRVTASMSFIDERWNVTFDSTTAVRLWNFTAGLFASAWLYAGWLRYPPPAMATTMVWLVVAVASGGAVAAWRNGGEHIRLALSVAAIFVVTQLIATYAVHFPIGSGAQGRYLFPIMAPFAAALSTGWLSLVSPRHARQQLAFGIFLAVAFDVIGWTAVLLPAYGQG